jgi:hypothetical protein
MCWSSAGNLKQIQSCFWPMLVQQEQSCSTTIVWAVSRMKPMRTCTCDDFTQTCQCVMLLGDGRRDNSFVERLSERMGGSACEISKVETIVCGLSCAVAGRT